MKKAVSILAITILMLSMTSVVTFAHGGHKKSRNTNVKQSCYELCTIASCDVSGPHQHDGVWHCSQIGHCVDYEICTVTGCVQLNLHKHNGVYYRCANNSTGHGCGRGRNR